MKVNKWTLGLAALGLVSLASAAKADEKQPTYLETALSSTTISGYVDTSFEWQMCNQDGVGIPFRGDNKRDGFNLNVVKLSLEKPLDESEWASGYKVDLLFGPDAVGYNPIQQSGGGGFVARNEGFGIKQAYVNLRAPIGNGVEFKVGTFDTIIGYEVFEAGSNPNFSRSWGWNTEPTQHTGVLGSYRVSDLVSVSAGVANTLTAGINARNTDNGGDDYWCKTYMGSIAVTAPEDWGWAAGSTLYGGIVSGWAGGSEDQNNYYAGLTLNTPVAGLTAGLAFDSVCNLGGDDGLNADVLGVYASFQATEKMSLHGRAEFGWWEDNGDDADSLSLTGTVQYDLWQNVLSRLELRYDQICWDSGKEESVAFYANIIYKF